MSGWLVQATLPETGAGRPVQVFAAWIADEMDALLAIETHVRATDNPPAQILCELSDEALTALGLSGAGQLARVQASS